MDKSRLVAARSQSLALLSLGWTPAEPGLRTIRKPSCKNIQNLVCLLRSPWECLPTWSCQCLGSGTQSYSLRLAVVKWCRIHHLGIGNPTASEATAKRIRHSGAELGIRRSPVMRLPGDFSSFGLGPKWAKWYSWTYESMPSSPKRSLFESTALRPGQGGIQTWKVLLSRNRALDVSSHSLRLVVEHRHCCWHCSRCHGCRHDGRSPAHK